MGEHPANQWLMHHWDEVAQNYPGQWIAASENGLVAHAPDVQGLFDQADKKGADPDDYIIQYVDPPAAPRQ